jgi:tetratricopeptide (TPR) repeat protein
MLVLHKPWHRAIGLAAFAGVALAFLAWIASKDPAINFLTRDKRANWIVFPTPPDSHAHWFTSLDTTFRREFTLTAQPRSAHLGIRAMRRAEVRINGTRVELPSNGDWKAITTTEAADQLRPGPNMIEVRVFNHNGPPALWLNLVTDDLSLRSDESWEASFAGSSWRHAALATTAKVANAGNSIADNEGTIDALREIWPFWIVLVAISFGLLVLWQISFRKSTTLRVERILFVVLASLWLLLFWNNARLLPFHAGFDSQEHLKYIEYIQQHRTLPSPNEGWEMYQPPLYYLIAAASLSACNLSINDSSSVLVLRLFGAFLGVAQFVFVFLSLRLLLPARTAVIGLLLAAFLPMHLYLAHNVTNEMLIAALSTVTLYLCLRLLKSDAPRLLQFAWVGCALGAAMLTKSTGVLLLPVVIVALAGRFLQQRTPIASSLRNLGILLTVCLAVCGWYYVHVWLKFGTPLVGNWDVFSWWQDVGYHTEVDYLRFGRSLIYPLFSGFAGFADGIYSTLWGDALCSGASSLTVAWNQQPLLAGYLWALVPTLLIVIGVVVAIIQFVRKPSSELFLLLGFSAVLMLGLIFMSLKIPSYAQAKAFYALSAITPLCFFGALGWETTTQVSGRLRFVFVTLLLVWALNSFATYWIIPGVAQHLYAAKTLATHGQIDRALVEAAKAVDVDQSNAIARGSYALCLSELGRDDEAINQAEREIQLKPDDSDAHLDLAVSVHRSYPDRANAEARRAIELGPENSSAYRFLMNCLLESRSYTQAADLGRDWLAVAPYDATAHSALASALASNGDVKSAARHLGYLMMLRPEVEQVHAQLRQILMSMAKEPDGLQRLRDIAANAPDSPRMLDELAWLLATYPDSNSRDGAEAVRLAERACALTDRRVPALLATLAAAYAETGDFPRAVATGEEALRRAQAIGDTNSVKLSENVLTAVRADLPYRHDPEQ